MDVRRSTQSFVLLLCEVLYSIAGTVDYDLNSNHITIRCEPNEKFAVLPKLNNSVTPNTVTVYDCELPDFPGYTYKSEFQRLNISIENLKTLYLQGNVTTMSDILAGHRLKTDTQFRGLPSSANIIAKFLDEYVTIYFKYTLTVEELPQLGEITSVGDSIYLECKNAGSLPTMDHIQTPIEIYSYFCDPSDSYSAMFNRVNINLSKAKFFQILPNAKFSPSYLIGLPNGTSFYVEIEETAGAIYYSGKFHEEDSELRIDLFGRGENPPKPPDMKTLASKLSNLKYKHLIVTGMKSEKNLHIADLVYSITSNISEINLVTLMGDMDEFTFLSERLFTNISLTSLVVDPEGKRDTTTIINNILVESSVFNIETLTNVYLKYVKMPVLPKLNNLADLTLENSVSEGKWGGCRNLRRLVLINHSFGGSFGPEMLEGTEGWLAHCKQLTELELRQLNSSGYWSEDGKFYDTLSIIISGLKSLKNLKIENSYLGKLADNSLFTNISLTSLVVDPQGIRDTTTIINNILVESSVFNIETLTNVYLKYVKMPVLPKLNNLADMTLENSVSEGKWGGCRNLRRLVLINHSFGRSFGPKMFEGTEGWLAHCEQLTELELRQLNSSGYWSEDGKFYDTLSIIISELKSLKKLKIENSYLGKLADNSFASLSKIEHIELTGSELQYPNFISGTSETIHTLILDYNKYTHGPDVEKYLGKLKHSITHISMKGQLPDEPMSKNFGDFTNLTYLDLSNSFLAGNFKVDYLPSNTKLPVLVDLRNNTILPSSRATCNDWINSYHHRRLLQAKNVTVLMSLTVPCDCSVGCLALQLSSLPTLNITGITCKENSTLLNRGMLANIDTFQCKKYSCGECTCRRRLRDNGTVAWCGALELRALPAALYDERNLVEIHAAGNAISRLRADDIPSTLLVLDLRNNSIIRADAAAATMFFSNKRSKIWLAGCTIDCGCNEGNLPWLTGLIENIKQIEDYQTVSCSEYTKGLLKNLNINELCAEPWTGWPLISSLSLISICALAAGFIVKRYQKQIRVFLFIHGLCLSCVQEEDSDADKQYDIFISFCHEDDDFVTDEILPKLSMYNLCIHYRDWMAGEWIPAQIARSVHHSKRSIIVMSKNFLRSSWGLMEFRMAHAATAEAGRARVIVVLREEVFNVPELDAELKSYLSTNTYVKWGDPWFFDKLRYALPREPIGQREELAGDGDDFRMAVKVYRRDDGETTLNEVE